MEEHKSELSNNSTEYNEIDLTKGNYTQEEESECDGGG